MTGKCVEVTFKPYSNGPGLSSETRTQMPPKGKGASPFGEHKVETGHHDDMESVRAHLEKHFPKAFAGSSNPGEGEERDDETAATSGGQEEEE